MRVTSENYVRRRANDNCKCISMIAWYKSIGINLRELAESKEPSARELAELVCRQIGGVWPQGLLTIADPKNAEKPISIGRSPDQGDIRF
jgi:hypothetical protein